MAYSREMKMTAQEHIKDFPIRNAVVSYLGNCPNTGTYTESRTGAQGITCDLSRFRKNGSVIFWMESVLSTFAGGSVLNLS
jgi:hypothetical protein